MAKLPRQIRRPSSFGISAQHIWETPEEYYLSIYYQVLDHVCDRLRCRITSKYIPILEAIEQLLDNSWKGAAINLDNLNLVCNHYGEDILNPKRLEAQLICLENLPEQNLHSKASVSQIVKGYK